jgi:glycosyltransferase involved in cell wall biosynthesis
VVPVFDHPQTLPSLIDALAPLGLRCWLVDDGSSPGCAACIDALVARNAGWLRCVRLPVNQGKGAAFIAGIDAAAADGYTHAVQIDADLQHDPGALPRFIAASQRAPQAVICGVARYDASVPALRFYGRYLTHVLVWLHTLSFDIRDSMCGLRVYPIAATLALERRRPVGRRMQFDTDVIVRLHWGGVPVHNLDTAVTYPADGVSHFDMWRDNLRMLRLHLDLLGGMLVRLPALLRRKLQRRAGPLRRPGSAG